MARWLDQPEQWENLARACREAGRIGWDSETVGHDPADTSPVGRARVVVWSVALPGKMTPRGFRRAHGVTLPLEAMLHPAMRGILEDEGVVKVAHNAVYDEHAARNAGVTPVGVVNTLTLARLALPHLNAWGLKSLMALLGRRPLGAFKDLFSRPRVVVRTVRKKFREVTCSCNALGCRKRKGHEKTVREWEEVWEEPHESGTELIPLDEISSNALHPMFDLLVRYAAEDAEAALELYEYLEARPAPVAPLPWGNELFRRPVDLWSQEMVGLDRTVTEMERRGVPVDLDLAAAMDAEAAEDETGILEKLAAWYLAVDAVGPEMPCNWGSGPQLQAFLHTPLGLNLPPSPFWKRGLVRLRDGDVKTDAVALEYLAGKHPEHREGIHLLLALRKVRGARKYFKMIRDHAILHEDGTWRVHPSFGGAGDGDTDGTVTGRFNLKNPALAQMATYSDRNDPQWKITSKGIPYPVRRCFVAPPGMELVVVDYSALEVVVLASICKALFGSDALERRIAPGAPDIHSVTAAYVFGEVLKFPECVGKPLAWYKGAGKVWRDLVKAIRYGLNYGKGAYGFGNTLFLPNGDPLGEALAQRMIDALLDMDPDIRRFQDWVREYILEYRGICSLSGRWGDLSDLIPGREWQENRAWRRALNYPMQAGAQEITAGAMVAIENDLALRVLGFRQILQIHDEIVGYCPIGWGAYCLERVKQLMVETYQLLVQLAVSGHTGRNWQEAK